MKVLRIVCLAAGMAATALSGVQAQDGVLRMARGAASQDVSVDMNRAVVLEAIQPFAEVSVANPGIADVAALSNTSIYILGKRSGRTTLTLLGENGRLIANVTVRVGPDLEELKDRYAEILPGEDIQIRTANDGLVLSGTISSAGRLARAMELANRYAPGRVSNMMTVGGTQQVLLKVRFAEVQRNVSKSLGIDWSFAWDGSGNLTGVAGGAANSVGASNFLTASWLAGGFLAGITIDALESKGFARTLAEPTLVALSGDTADFLAGGEFPIPLTGDNGELSVEFRSFGIGLGFTPTVLDDDLINLQVSAESSNLDSTAGVSTGGITINGLSTRRANTTVELRDGESFAIAGLLQDTFRDNAGQVPWLGDVPVLGTLFKSTDYTSSQSELVIIVTVHLVTPTTLDALELPTDRVRIPSEEELFLFGRLSDTPVVNDVAAQNFQGAYGYVME